MERTKVQSSNVLEVGYDSETKTLQVAFSGGGVYDFLDVPAEKHAAMLKASSVGGYFFANIKGKYEHKKHGASA